MTNRRVQCSFCCLFLNSQPTINIPKSTILGWQNFGPLPCLDLPMPAWLLAPALSEIPPCGDSLRDWSSPRRELNSKSTGVYISSGCCASIWNTSPRQFPCAAWLVCIITSYLSIESHAYVPTWRLSISHTLQQNLSFPTKNFQETKHSVQILSPVIGYSNTPPHKLYFSVAQAKNTRLIFLPFPTTSNLAVNCVNFPWKHMHSSSSLCYLIISPLDINLPCHPIYFS